MRRSHRLGERMRFLILTQYYPPEIGAAQARLSAFARELVNAGHEVEVVTALPNYPSGRLTPNDRFRPARSERIEGIPVRRIWLLTGTGAGAKRLASYLSFTATGFVGAVAAERPDVVFTESPPLFLGLSGLMAARRWGAAFILNVSDLWPDSIRDLGLMGDGMALSAAGWLERWLYRRATAVTAVTEGIRARLIKAKGVPRRQVLFLPNGADLRSFRPMPDDGGLRREIKHPKGPIVLFTGNHGYAQSLETVVTAAMHVPEANFVFVGGGSDKARIQSLARDLGATNVRFLEPVPLDGIAPLYGASIAGLATLRASPLMEGARPAKALAIMACGRPVLYAGSGEGAALVEGADAGIVVPPEQPLRLAEAVRELIADPIRAAEMGANGRRFVQEHLSWPALTASWLAQLDALLQQDRGTVDGPQRAS